jgi:hypothetical protein
MAVGAKQGNDSEFFYQNKTMAKCLAPGHHLPFNELPQHDKQG